MNETGSTFPPPSDAHSAQDDVVCPLCEYNLRGLAEPRCPECGARFEWEELRDPSRRRHPYLFEHYPERNVSSFVQTILGGWRTGKFWKTLLPAQPSNPRRLILYWVLCIVLAMSGFVLQMYSSARMLNLLNERERARFVAFGTLDPKWKQRIQDTYGSFEAYFDATAMAPLYPSAGFFKELFGISHSSAWLGGSPLRERWGVRCYLLLELIVFWPLVVVLVMMMLRATMRRAQIRMVHLFRVAIYCGDVGVWLGLLLCLPSLYELTGINVPVFGTVANTARWWPATAISVMTIRLTFAIARYLRFRHALPTALAVQIIFLLAAMKGFMMLLGY